MEHYPVTFFQIAECGPSGDDVCRSAKASAERPLFALRPGATVAADVCDHRDLHSLYLPVVFHLVNAAVEYGVVHAVVHLGIDDRIDEPSAWSGEEPAHLNGKVNSTGEFSNYFGYFAESCGFFFICFCGEVIDGKAGSVLYTFCSVSERRFEFVEQPGKTGYFLYYLFRSGLLSACEVVYALYVYSRDRIPGGTRLRSMRSAPL